MNLLALEFPPVSQLFDWPDIWFKGTVLAINKTVLIYLGAMLITMAIFALAGRPRESLVPSGFQPGKALTISSAISTSIMRTITIPAFSSGMRSG